MTERIFMTGATGYLGSYVLDLLLRESDAEIALLTRAANRAEGEAKLWKALQLHMSAEAFRSYLPRLEVVSGDLSRPGLGIEVRAADRVSAECGSVLHVAASLNRKSEKACLNHNVRGTLSMIQLARRIQERHGLRRFSFVSTTAVAGKRQGETLDEDEALDFERSDYDPYARTKKLCEHLLAELLPDVDRVIFRPSTVMGDSRFPETTQFDMVRATNTIFQLPVFPIRAEARVDIVNADWVGRAIATLHRRERCRHGIYHLSSGTASHNAKEIATVFARAGRRPPLMVPGLLAPTQIAIEALAALPYRNAITYVGSLFKVFLPYITFDTVFDNARAVDELGVAPASFLEYGPAYAAWAREHGYAYPYVPLPQPSARPAPRAEA